MKQLLLNKDKKTKFDHMLNNDNYSLNKVYSNKSFETLRVWIKKRESQTVFSKTGINCQKMFSNDEKEFVKAEKFMKSKTVNLNFSLNDLVNLSNNCKEFKEQRGYILEPESIEEENFPIAFNILFYKDLLQVERLLRAIYAPQNIYCLHVDDKADEEIKIILRRISSCFANVVLPKRFYRVSWGHMSIMYAEIICMEELIKYQWKYFINLSGQMFPTKTNKELVQILKLLDGANDIEGSILAAGYFRFRFRHVTEWKYSSRLNLNLMTFNIKSYPPYNITIFKGSNQIVATRAFVVYFLYSKISQDIIEWFSNTLVPDEHIWSSLNHNVHLKIPGGYKGDPETKPFIARYTLWNGQTNYDSLICKGEWKNGICIFGIKDLPWLIIQNNLFLNKFHYDYQGLGYDCLEEYIFNKTKTDILNDQQRFFLKSIKLNQNYGEDKLTFYKNLPYVKNKSLFIHLNESALGDYIRE